MRRSSARQQEFEFSPAGTSSSGDNQDPMTGEMSESVTSQRPDPGTSQIFFPKSEIPRDLYADISRRAGRLNAANISDREFDHLLLERQLLLDKKFNETITRSEMIRLEYVRWQLDRIEDARHGETLDALEVLVNQYERFRDDIEALQEELTKKLRGKRK